MTNETLNSIQHARAKYMVDCDCCDREVHQDNTIRIGDDFVEREELVCFDCADWLGLPVCPRCGYDELDYAGEPCLACYEAMTEAGPYIRAEMRGYRV